MLCLNTIPFIFSCNSYSSLSIRDRHFIIIITEKVLMVRKKLNYKKEENSRNVSLSSFHSHPFDGMNENVVTPNHCWTHCSFSLDVGVEIFSFLPWFWVPLSYHSAAVSLFPLLVSDHPRKESSHFSLLSCLEKDDGQSRWQQWVQKRNNTCHEKIKHNKDVLDERKQDDMHGLNQQWSETTRFHSISNQSIDVWFIQCYSPPDLYLLNGKDGISLWITERILGLWLLLLTPCLSKGILLEIFELHGKMGLNLFLTNINIILSCLRESRSGLTTSRSGNWYPVLETSSHQLSLSFVFSRETRFISSFKGITGGFKCKGKTINCWWFLLCPFKEESVLKMKVKLIWKVWMPFKLNAKANSKAHSRQKDSIEFLSQIDCLLFSFSFPSVPVSSHFISHCFSCPFGSFRLWVFAKKGVGNKCVKSCEKTLNLNQLCVCIQKHLHLVSYQRFIKRTIYLLLQHQTWVTTYSSPELKKVFSQLPINWCHMISKYLSCTCSLCHHHHQLCICFILSNTRHKNKDTCKHFLWTCFRLLS